MFQETPPLHAIILYEIEQLFGKIFQHVSSFSLESEVLPKE